MRGLYILIIPFRAEYGFRQMRPEFSIDSMDTVWRHGEQLSQWRDDFTAHLMDGDPVALAEYDALKAAFDSSMQREMILRGIQ